MFVYTSRNESLTLSDGAMSSGGEGEIHSVISKPDRFNNVCVKIYFKPKRTEALERKIKYMVANPPHQIYSESYMIGWPLDIVYDKQKDFIGFVMPLAYGSSEPLIVLTAKNLSKKLDIVWTDKYDRRLGAASMISRLKLICNIAIPIHILHSTGKYVLKDFKPENVLVTCDGKVTLVDMDSVQITENNRLLFIGTAATPNYIPPEYYTRNVGKDIKMPIAKSWDYFAIGVVFYQVIFGLHPYVVTPVVAKDENSNEIFNNIAQNLFPFGANAAKVKSYPPPHNNFTHIPAELQELFKQAFSDIAEARPTLERWVKTIKDLIQKAPVPPRPITGTISVKCSPSAASVKLNNNYIGMSPVCIRVKAGFHRIDLSCNGFSQSYDSVEVKKGETTYIDAHFNYSEPTKNDNTESGNSTSNNSGCLWGAIAFVIICLIPFLIYMGVKNDTASHLNSTEELVDSVEADDVVEVDDVVEADTVIYVPEDDEDDTSVNAPSVEIENIWVDYNVYQDGNKGMRIHVKFNNKNLCGEELSVNAFFYQEDNVAKLYDVYGNHLGCYRYCIPESDDSIFEDFELFMSYSNMAPGTDGTFSFDISIMDSSGNQLARKNNIQFNFSNI